jgi:hypothetical protein
MTLRSRIALIRARTSADLSELQERQSHMLLLRVEQGNLGRKSLRENWVLEGHGFSRAVNDTAIVGFSR